MDARGRPEGLVLFLFTVLTICASGYVVVSSELDYRDDPAEKARRGEIQGLDELSLLRQENLQRILDEVEEGEHPLVVNLRVSAIAVDATVRDADGYRKILTFDPAFEHDERDFEVGEDAALRAREIDAGGPERMAREATRRAGVDADAVDYVTLSAPSSGEASWYLALDEGPARVRQWVAAMDGSDLRKPGEPARADR